MLECQHSRWREQTTDDVRIEAIENGNVRSDFQVFERGRNQDASLTVADETRAVIRVARLVGSASCLSKRASSDPPRRIAFLTSEFATIASIAH